MKKQLQSLLLLIMAASSTISFAQTARVKQALERYTGPSINMENLKGNNTSPRASFVDTLYYTVGKDEIAGGTGNFVIWTLANTLAWDQAFGQKYHAPQPMTVKGLKFQSYTESGVAATAKVSVYSVAGNGFPGALLGSTQVSVTTAAMYYAAFPSPISLSADYYVVVENLSTTEKLANIITDATVGVNPGAGEEFSVYIYDGIWYSILTDDWYEADVDMIMLPVVEYDITANYTATLSACEGQTVNFSNTSSAILNNRMYNVNKFIEYFIPTSPDVITYKWEFPTVFNTSNASQTYATAGSYNASLTVKMEAWTGEIISNKLEVVTVSAEVTPSVSLNLTNGNNPTCPTAELTFTANALSGGTAPTYQWFLDGISVGTGSTYTSDSFTDQDELYVVLTSNANCVTSTTATSSTQTITVDAGITLTPMVSIAGNNSICPGTTVTFNATPTNGGSTPAYEWFIGANSVGTGNTFTSSALNNGDQLYVEMASSLACANPSDVTSSTVSISVSAPAAASFTSTEAGGEVTFTNSSTGAGSLTYAWDFGDSNTSTVPNPVHTYASNGTYSVTLTVTDDCGTATESSSVVILTISINNQTAKNKVTVYPNPSNGIININTTQNATVVVYNAIGSVVSSSVTNNNSLTIDLNNQAKGIYFVRIVTNDGIVVEKVNITN